MKRPTLPSLLYSASSPEAGEARACWAIARRAARYIKDRKILPDEELAFSRIDDTSVGVSRFLCGPDGRLRDLAMIAIDTTRLPRRVATSLDSLADTAAVHTGSRWRTARSTSLMRGRSPS